MHWTSVKVCDQDCVWVPRLNFQGWYFFIFNDFRLESDWIKEKSN